MCNWLSVVALDMDGNPREDIEPIEFDAHAAYEATGYCTCWISKPEGKALLDRFVDQCIKPMLAQVSIGAIKIVVD